MFPLSSFRRSHPALSKLRSYLSTALMLVMFLAPLAIRTSAQASSPDGKVPQSDHFVFYTGPNGEFSCREATLEEARELDQIRPQGLRPITHESEIGLKGENATAENVDHLTIILRATDQLNLPENAAAKAAFIRAAQIWEVQIKSPITVYIDVDFGSTNFGQPWEGGVIGSTSAPTVTTSFGSIRTQLIAGASTASETTLYNSLPTTTLPTNQGGANSITASQAIGRAIGLLPATAPNPDTDSTTLRPRIAFNSTVTYDFDPNDGSDGLGGDGIDFGKTDFEAVAVHEIGHALGFTSRAGRTTATNPAVWDIFRFRSGTTVGTFGTAQRIMTADGLQFHFSGSPEVGLSTGGIDGEAPGGDGNQSSHWKEKHQNGGAYIGIMDPTIGKGERRQITANDTLALDSFGYNLSNSNPPPPPPPPPPAPANNDFANAQVITGCSGSVTGTNIGANKQSGEPSHSPDGNAGAHSVWYQWQAPSSGSVTIDTSGSTYDTLLGVYTGNSVNGLTVIKKNDDVDLGVIVHSTVTFDAVAGTVYKIAVDGWGGDAGSIVLNWTQSNCTVAQYFVNGRVVDNQNNPVSGVLITFEIDRQGTPSSSTTQTDANGNYVSGDLGGCNNRVIVRPSKTNYTFSPLSISFVSTGCLTGTATANFTGTLSSTPSNTIQLSASSYQAAENAGSTQITVNRTVTTAAATVNYATSDSSGLASCTVTSGAASERCDYQTVAGTLRFSAGESSKTFSIPIINDAHNESNETFTVTLTNPTGGASLSSPATATVTILDDSLPTVNPIEDPQFFITQQYIDFLGRLPDSTGLANWMTTLTGCPNGGFGEFDNPHCDRVHVSAGFFQSEEFRGRGYWAYRFYEVAFNRRPTYAEFVPDMAQVGGPQSPESEALSKNQYKDDFVQRGEFTGLYNGLSNVAFVNAIEANAEVNLDNAALTLQLDGGKSRAQLLREIVESKPVEDQFFIRAFVAMQYFGYLRRDPDTVGYNNWVTTLTANPSDYRHMIFGFIYSDEYRKRFGL